MDHGSVAADEGLHDVCGHHVGQGFLQDVAGSFFAEESGDEDLVQGFHATNTGALGGGDIGRVDDAEQFGGGEACAEERINGGDKVPHGDAVETFDHGAGDAPVGGVEVGGQLTTNNAAECGFARDACLGATLLVHQPFAVFGGADAGGCRVGVHVVLGFFLGGHGEGDVAVEVDGGYVDGAFVNQGVVVHEAADTGAGNYFVAEAVVDVFLGDGFAGGVVPAGCGVVGPVDQAGHPGEFQHTGGGEVNVAVALDAVFREGAGAAGAPGGDFAQADNNHHVFQRRGDFTQVNAACLLRCGGRGQRVDGDGLLFGLCTV